MRIEKINSNQIKCVLNKEDLLSRHINVSELAYGSDKAQELFKDMIKKASYEFGFETENIPLMIEAVPLSSDGIMLIMTKVDNPDDLDDTFTGLSFPSARTFKKKEDTKEALLPEHIHSKEHNDEIAIDHNISAFFVYGFNNLDDISTAVKSLSPYSFNQSRVYKSNSSYKYLLSIQTDSVIKSDCRVIRGLLSEYGEAIHCRKTKLDYYDEHYVIIIKDSAIDKLSQL